MSTKLLMGNEAIAHGAIKAGVSLVAGYPGTPSTEILETIAKLAKDGIYVEWSVNEKAALEVASGAAYAGARTLVTMKQVGLNVASDPLMSLSYIGIKGGMVVVVADDPGPISSQTEQDTRHFAEFSKLPIFDPSSPEEAYIMIGEAFDYSEKYGTPVLFRPTTRVCHGCAAIKLDDCCKIATPEGFIKDDKWVIFPRLSYNNHIKIEARNVIIAEDFSSYYQNKLSVCKDTKKGIATGGISYAYTMEALALYTNDLQSKLKVLKVSTPFPFPEKLALEFLDGLDEVTVIEELDPVIERALIFVCGKHHLNVKINGKLNGCTTNAGENTVEQVAGVIADFAKIEYSLQENMELPPLPMRPPVLCAGCPHRASFYAVKVAMKGKKAVFSGDIGCYTLGNAAPLHMVDTCLCMGAGVTIAQGLHRIEPNAVNFAFIGDSTFFASGMTGVANAVYNQTDIVLIVLDNSTTAMTGHQPHPGTGKTMMGSISEKISIEKVLQALGVASVQRINPLELDTSIAAIKQAAGKSGVNAIIFESPCIALFKPVSTHCITTDCIGCKRCINELGCPAITFEAGRAKISADLCYDCGLCKFICPKKAIVGGKSNV